MILAKQRMKMISPFLKDALKLVMLALISKIGNGQHIKFWIDRWYQGGALSSIYSYLFQICTNSLVSLQEVVLSQGNNITFF